MDSMPTDSQERKDTPLARGLLDYFPAALAEVARVSKVGNDKHNPGEEMHHSRGKSSDHADCIVRHLVDRGRIDPDDGQRHSAKVAWRALALLQEELEADGAPTARAARWEPMPITGPRESFGEWTPWFGETDAPPPAMRRAKRYSIRLRDGHEEIGCGCDPRVWVWRHFFGAGDIVAYRVDA